MVEDIKVSIVIPIYNNLETIERCLDSIYSQTYGNVECILSDDCSDVSYEFLKEKYNGLIVSRLEVNSGAGVSRQYALDNVVTGEWVMFVDSDDMLYDKNVISTLVRSIHRNKNINAIHGKHIYQDKNNNIVEINFGYDVLHGMIFKVSFLKKHNIRFHDTLRYHEDVYFMNFVKYVNNHFYNGKSIPCIQKICYKQHFYNKSVTQMMYDGEEYCIAKFKDHSSMFFDLYEKVKTFLTEEESMSFWTNVLLHGFRTCNKFETEFGYCKEEDYKHCLKIFNKMNELFGWKTCEDFVENIIKNRKNNVLNVLPYIDISKFKDFYYKCYCDKIQSVLLSIIIPVYNSKGIIQTTLDKLYKELNNDCEVIIVDDCSTDGDYYYLEDIYNNLKVYRQDTNKGYATSRQLGVDNCNGKWIIFLDHDDYLESGFLNVLYNDLYMGNYSLIHYGHRYHYYNRIYTINKANLDLFHGCVFNVDFIKKYNIKFSEKLKSSEDVYYHRVVYNYLINNNPEQILEHTDVVLYNWKFHGNNQTGLKDNERIWLENNHNDHVKAVILSLSYFDLNKEYVVKTLFNTFVESIVYCDIFEKHSSNFRKEIYEDINTIKQKLIINGVDKLQFDKMVDNEKEKVFESVYVITNMLKSFWFHDIEFKDYINNEKVNGKFLHKLKSSF